MAEALGWGATDRPVPTVCAGGGPGGGPEPFPSGARKTLTDARDRGTWTEPPKAADIVLKPQTRGAGWTARHGTRGNSPASGPAPTCTSKAAHWTWALRSNNQSNATIRGVDEPAGTLFFGHRANECMWVARPAHGEEQETTPPAPIRITAAEPGTLQTFPDDYPWQGTKGAKSSQIGNAVPPRLAAHLLAPHLDRTLTADDFTLAA